VNKGIIKELCKMHFDTLNRSCVDHECDRQTDRRTERTGASNSVL